LNRVNILGVFAFEPAEHLWKDWTTDWREEIDVAGMCPWLSRDVNSPISENLVSPKEVSMCQGEHYLWPTTHIVGAVH
jgi:hypothetical protein